MKSARDLAVAFFERCAPCDGSGLALSSWPDVMREVDCPACKGSGRLMSLDDMTKAIEARDAELREATYADAYGRVVDYVRAMKL